MRAFLLAALLWPLALPAHAQFVLNNTPGAISGATACPAAGFTRTFEINRASTVQDVDLGIDLDHSWRGDVRARLTSPAGTTVEVLTADTSASGNLENYRIRLDDGAATLVNTGAHAVNTAATAPRYSDRVRPSNALSAFNGQNAQGTWSLEICDDFPAQDNGTLLRATLFIVPVAAPQPPVLSCAAGTLVPFDWTAPGTTDGWSPGTLVNGYAAQGIPLAFAVTGDTADLASRNGLAAPHTSTEFDAGAARHALLVSQDPPNRTNQLSVAVNLGQSGTGVGGVEFTLLDVDRDLWSDSVTVQASLGGVGVPVTLTPSAGNRVDGPTVRGTARIGSTSPDGRAVVSVLQSVDRIVMTYGNGPDAAANPPAQVIGFYGDMKLCPIGSAELSAVKSVELLDPDGLGAFLTPGNSVLYKITVTHGAASTGSATDIDISDTLPPTVTFVSAAHTGFTTGAFNNSDCPGAACTVVFEGGELPQGTVGEIAVTAIIN